MLYSHEFSFHAEISYTVKLGPTISYKLMDSPQGQNNLVR